MRNDKDNLIVKLSYEFALDIIEFTGLLESMCRYNMANQLFRTGTAIVANVREAQNAESKTDFVHKMKIAAKEADETEYWLCLCRDAKNYPEPGILLHKIDSINRILSKIISTTKSTTYRQSSNRQIIKSSNK